MMVRDMNKSTPIARDDEGYLIQPEDWTVDLAAQLAREEKLELGDEHWMLLRFMRAYYEEHQVAPDSRHAIRHFAEMSGSDPKQARARLFELFPYGYVQQACKIAGMKRPRAWSTG